MATLLQVLSSMSLGPDRFVQRCAVLGGSGEAATLTFRLQKEERLEPSYRSISVVRTFGCLTRSLSTGPHVPA